MVNIQVDHLSTGRNAPVKHFNRNFHFAAPIPTRLIDRTAFPNKVLAGLGPRPFQRRREGRCVANC
jgi:hypothetical protein